MLDIKHRKRIKVVCWVSLAALFFLLWKRPVTVPVREGAVEVTLYYRGQEVRIEDENQIKFLEENLRQTGIVRKLLWPSSGEHFGIVFLYEDGASENFDLSSANYLKGQICLGGWRSSAFGVIYSSDEPIYQPVYDWLNGIWYRKD